jgi:hypothetical protein
MRVVDVAELVQARLPLTEFGNAGVSNKQDSLVLSVCIVAISNACCVLKSICSKMFTYEVWQAGGSIH